MRKCSRAALVVTDIKDAVPWVRALIKMRVWISEAAREVNGSNGRERVGRNEEK